jgi:hypothetical protein
VSQPWHVRLGWRQFARWCFGLDRVNEMTRIDTIFLDPLLLLGTPVDEPFFNVLSNCGSLDIMLLYGDDKGKPSVLGRAA